MNNLFKNRKLTILIIAIVTTTLIAGAIIFYSIKSRQVLPPKTELKKEDLSALEKLNRLVADKRIDSYGKGTIFEKYPELIKFQLDKNRYVIKLSSAMLYDPRYTKLLESNPILLESIRSKSPDRPTSFEIIYDILTSSSDNAFNYMRNFQLGYLNAKEVWLYQNEKNLYISDADFKNTVIVKTPFVLRDSAILEVVDTTHFVFLDYGNIEDTVGIYEFSIQPAKTLSVDKEKVFPINVTKFATRNDVIDPKNGPIYYEFAPFIKPIGQGKYIFITTAKNGLNFELYDSQSDKFVLLSNYNKPIATGYHFNCTAIKQKCFLYYDQTGELTIYDFSTNKPSFVNGNISNYKEYFALITDPKTNVKQSAFNRVDDYLFLDNRANQVLFASKDGWKKLVDM